MFSYSEVRDMDWDQMYEANAALDLYLEARRAEEEKTAEKWRVYAKNRRAPVRRG